MKSFKADILSISPFDKGLTLKTSPWQIYVINSVDNSKIPSYWINWSNLKSRHNLLVLSVYLPQMKVLLFCTDTIHKFMMSVARFVLVMIELLSLDSLTHSVMSWLPVSCISGRGPMTPLPPSLSLSMMAQKQINQMCLNPLCPIISMYILQTVLCTFPMVLIRRISFNNLWLVIISFILVTLMVDSGVIL